MSKIFFRILIMVVLLSSGCAVQHKSLTGIRRWNYPQHQMDSIVSFSFVENVLEKSGNKRQEQWAKRKQIKIIGIKLINNTKKNIHGTQISFFLNDKKQEIIHNQQLAKKVRQRVSPLLIFTLPFFILEDALFHRDDDEYYDNTEPFYITEELLVQNGEQRKDSNFNLRQELVASQIASRVLIPVLSPIIP